MIKLLIALLMVTIVTHDTENEPQWRWSDREASIISYLGAAPSEYKISITRPQSSGIKDLKVAISDGDSVLCRFESNYQGAFLFDRNRNWIIYSQYSPIATGCTLIAYDLKTKQQVWKTNLKGIGPVSHSKWRNRINLKLETDRVTVFGDEGTKYIESVSLASGETVYHRMLATTVPNFTTGPGNMSKGKNMGDNSSGTSQENFRSPFTNTVNGFPKILNDNVGSIGLLRSCFSAVAKSLH